MAKKRKLAQNNSIPTSEPEPNPEPEPETQSQPEPEPELIEEEQPPIKEEEPQVEEKEQEEDDDDGEEDEPQTLENPNPTPDPTASNGGGEEEDSDPESLQKILELFPMDQLVELLRDAAGRHADVRRDVHRLADVDPALRKIFVHGLGWDTPDPTASNGGGEEEDSDPESLQKILELFPMDQLVELLRDAAGRHADVRREVHRLADVDPALRKIFGHGLGWDTNAKVLTDVFSQYGEIEHCNAVTDKATGKSKGYALILFKHRKGAQSALREPQKKIGNRMTAWYGIGLGGYGGQAQVQGGYGGAQMGQGGVVRGQQGYGHAGGGPHYMGHH